MSSLYYIDDDGVATPVTIGPRGRTGPSVYDVWLADGNTGTVADFLRSVAPEAAPSRTVLSTSGAATATIPSDVSLVTLDVTAPCEVTVADYVSAPYGTNPDGWSFTLHLTGIANAITFAPGVVVHGSLGAATEAWCTVIRDTDWHVLVGVTG